MNSNDDLISVNQAIARNIAEQTTLWRQLLSLVVPGLQRGPTVIANGLMTGAAVQITNIPQDFAYLYLELNSFTFVAAATGCLVQLSNDNGASYAGVAGNYASAYITAAGPAVGINTEISLCASGVLTTAGDAGTIFMNIYNYQDGFKLSTGTSFTSGGNRRAHNGRFTAFTGGLNAMQFVPSTATTFNGGSYRLLGYR